MKYSESFIPRRVIIYKCSNYKSDTPTEIVFDKFTGILGETGAGKSSIIDAITFPIWKTTPRLKGNAIKIEDFCDVGGFCEVEFEKNGNLYRIRRGRKRNGSFVTLHINGERFPETSPKKVDAKIAEIMNIDYESFAISGYIPQDEVKEIINKTNGERLNLMKNIFKLDIFDDALEITKNRLKDVENEIAKAESRLSEMKSFVSRNADLGERIKEKTKRLKILLGKIKSQNERVKSVEAELEKYREGREQYVKYKDRLNSLSNRKTRLSESLHQYKTKLSKYRSEMERLPDDFGDIDTLRGLLEKISEIKSLQKSLSNYRANYNKIKATYEKRKREIGLDADKPEIDGMELLKRYRTDMSITAEEVYDAIRNETVYSIYKNLDDEFKEQTSELVSQIKSTEKRIAELKSELGKENESSLRAKISALEKSREKRIKLESAVKSLGDNIEKAEKELRETEESIDVTKEKITLFESAYTEYGKIKEKVDSERKTLMTLISEKEGINGELTQMKKTLSEIEEIKERMEKTEQKLLKMKRKETVLQIIKKNVFHKKGMAIFTLQTILSDIEFKASEIITSLTYHRTPAFKKDGTPNRMQKLRLIPDRYGLSIEVDGVNVRRYSGGEKTIIAIALRLAIFQQLMEMSELSSSMRVLIIDEGDLRSLDDQTIDAFIQLLQSYENIFDRIILITHIEKAVAGFDRIIYVRKDPETGYSTIIE